MNKIRVLLINKNEVYLRYMQYRLELEEDLEVVGIYASAEEAFRDIERLLPNVILTDPGFLEVKNIELCRQMVGKRRDCDIIMLFSNRDLKRDTLTTGPADCTEIKIDYKSLIASIRQVYELQLPGLRDSVNRHFTS